MPRGPRLRKWDPYGGGAETNLGRDFVWGAVFGCCRVGSIQLSRGRESGELEGACEVPQSGGRCVVEKKTRLSLQRGLVLNETDGGRSVGDFGTLCMGSKRIIPDRGLKVRMLP